MASVSNRPFNSQLRHELRERGWGLRRLAKKIDPVNPERARRNINRWLAGTTPSPASRRSCALALALPEDYFGSEDEEESVATTLQSIAANFAALAQRMERVA